MAINSDHVTGFAVGLGAAAVGFYLYKKNQARVDDWLREQGVNVPAAASRDTASMSLEELTLEKERLEDLIAEREMAAGSESAPEEAPAS
jgi:hypothetical protein